MATPSEELINAVNTDDAAGVAELVAEDPSLASTRDLGGVSALMLSRYRFNRETTDALLAADPDLDVFEATALGYIDRLRERLMADPGSATAFSPDGFTALHFAGFFGKVEAARELISAGASVDVYTTNDFANQPLHAAAAGRHLEVCRVLLGAGAGVNATQHGGYTPLHEAAQSGDVELAELFLSAGADPSAVSDAGETPAATAEAAGHHDLAARIREVAEAR
jgi:ankyrin repeat protein